MRQCAHGLQKRPSLFGREMETVTDDDQTKIRSGPQKGESQAQPEGAVWTLPPSNADVPFVEGNLESRFGALKIFVAQLSPDGTILESNARLNPLPDFDPEDLAPDEEAQVRDVLRRVFHTGEAFSCRFARRSATQTRWFEHRIGPTLLTEGDVTTIPAATWVVLDVTSHVELHSRTTEMHRQRSLEKLAGGVAHDFNNLLTAILGNTLAVLEELDEADPRLSPLEDVRSAAVRAAGLSRQLLAFSGKTGNEVATIDVGQLVKSLSKTITSTLPSTTKIEWKVTADDVKILADEIQLQHVLLQLVLNASEALESRVGKVSVEVGRWQVTDADLDDFTLGREEISPGEYVYVDVKDDGHGMDAETRRRMFDPFFTTRFIGRGMGLAASAGITRAHKGGFLVRSQRAQGTTVRVVFPIATALDDADPTPLPTQHGRGRRILVVDDEPVVLRFTKRALEKFGFDVTCAESGEVALNEYKNSPFDLVLLDMTMPKMSGEQTFAALREFDPGVRTILMSGYNAVEATRRFTSAGLAGFIEKPYSARKLAAKVEEVLRSTVSSLH